METESINLIFAAILLVLTINSTILWSVVYSIHVQNSLDGGQKFANLTSQKIVAGSTSNLSALQVSPPGVSALKNVVVPAAGANRSGPDLSGAAVPYAIPGVQPPLNTGVALRDSALLVPAVNSRPPARTMASYVSIEMPEAPKNENHQVLQDTIARRNLDNFVTVYALANQTLSTRLPRISMNLVNPPLVIDYHVTPISIKDQKYIEYKTGKTLHKENISVNRFSENSWFRVVVRDKDTGEIVAEDGVGRTNAFENHRQLMVWTCGNYAVEFEGETATIVNLTIKVRNDGLAP